MHRLLEHDVIGLDMDNTLIDAGAYSDALVNFVKQNPNKTYHVITFRDLYNWSRDSSIAELKVKAALEIGEHFEDIHFCDEWKNDDFDLPNWKGWVSVKLGCTIMIDDRTDWVEPGCKKYDVAFINTFDLEI